MTQLPLAFRLPLRARVDRAIARSGGLGDRRIGGPGDTMTAAEAIMILRSHVDAGIVNAGACMEWVATICARLEAALTERAADAAGGGCDV